MESRLLPQAGRRRTAAETDLAGVLRGGVESAQHARGAAGSVANAARIGDFLGGFAHDRLFLAGHEVFLLEQVVDQVQIANAAPSERRLSQGARSERPSSTCHACETMKGLAGAARYWGRSGRGS